MKTALIIASVVLVISLGVAWYMFIQPAPQPLETTPDTGQSPVGSYQSSVTPVGVGGQTGTSTGVTGIVPAQEGSPVEVVDFTKDSNIKEDPNNPGIFYLAGGSPTEEVYTISYTVNDGSFTISLFSEPLGERRKQAESFLLNQLGISEYDACRLRYVVLTPYWVNSIYAGKNLGFSFCPGATPL